MSGYATPCAALDRLRQFQLSQSIREGVRQLPFDQDFREKEFD
jgi:hypothetical protein